MSDSKRLAATLEGGSRGGSRLAGRFGALMIALWVLGLSGCTWNMLRTGWDIHSRPMGHLETGEPAQPIATKTPTGGIEITYNERVFRNYLIGGGEFLTPGNRLHRSIGYRTTTRETPASALKSVAKLGQFRRNSAQFPIAKSVSSFVAVGGVLPVVEVDSSASSFTLPDRECIFWLHRWIWYVPAQFSGGEPLFAIVSQPTVHTPASAYVGRSAMLPLTLAIDIALAPVALIVYAFVGW